MIHFVSLVGDLAWPSATLAIVVLFRREVRAALGRLGQVKYAGVEVNFRDDLKQAELLAAAAPPADAPAHTLPPSRLNFEAAEADASELPGTLIGRDASTATTVVVTAGPKPEPRSARNLESFLRVCQESPRLGVLEAWDHLGQALMHAAIALGDRRSPMPVRVESATRFLVDRGWLGGVEGQLVDRLRRIADLVERREGPPIAADEARRFVDLVLPLAQRVGGLA